MTEPAPPNPARYIMIGGFLGAGKSTAILALAERLRRQGRRVGLITNDQSVGLVDTAWMRSAGFDVAEIAGGCFCCRFDSLTAAADRLTEASQPDVFLAEPVGSCTDLVATVSYPLGRIYGDRYAIAPLSVLVDPVRCARVLGLRTGKSFSHKVVYVYRKQLEEADRIVINKRDAVEADLLDELRAELGRQFPRAGVRTVSARTGDGLDGWFDELQTERIDPRRTMPIDYDRYAEGEALLGWLNATLRLEAAEPIDGEAVMMDLAERIQRALNEAGAEVAHLKMTLLADRQAGRTATLNLVRGDWVPELSQSLPERTAAGRLVVNLRAEADPARLRAALDDAVAHARRGVTMRLEPEHIEHFRPARPQPTWRMPDAESLHTDAPTGAAGSNAGETRP